MSSEDGLGNFSVELVCHSVNPVGDEVVTWRLCYERFIHAEFMTHRCARNASSSRAIPYERMKRWIDRDPALPLHWGMDQPGMKSSPEEVDPDAGVSVVLGAYHDILRRISQELGGPMLHKEIVNRYLEPWGWINVVASMGRTQLMNFFTLRCAKEVNPNMQRLAVTMARVYRKSVPTLVQEGDWHLPFTDDIPADSALHDKLAWSVARCAWTSYQTVDGRKATMADARKRHDKCVELKHLTPCEHQYRSRSDHAKGCGCVPGWISYRHMVPGEQACEFDFSILDTVYKDRDYVV